jgi:hypothetical protein
VLQTAYPIVIADFNSAGIRARHPRLGQRAASRMREIGSHGEGDARYTAYAMPRRDGSEFVCLNTKRRSS